MPLSQVVKDAADFPGGGDASSEISHKKLLTGGGGSKLSSLSATQPRDLIWSFVYSFGYLAHCSLYHDLFGFSF